MRLVHQLVGYDDVNFVVSIDGVKEYILKCSFDESKGQWLEHESTVMQQLSANGQSKSYEIPKVVVTDGGQNVGRSTVKGREVLFRLLSFLPGSTVIEYKYRSSELLHQLGEAAGALNTDLAQFSGKHFDRQLEWDLKHLNLQLEYVDAIPDEQRSAIVRRAIQDFEALRRQRHDQLPQTLIHDDLNDANMLVADGMIGIIDFEDLVTSYSVSEPAVALAYLTAGEEDFITRSTAFLKGYCIHAELSEGRS